MGAEGGRRRWRARCRSHSVLGTGGAACRGHLTAQPPLRVTNQLDWPWSLQDTPPEPQCRQTSAPPTQPRLPASRRRL